MAVTSSLVPPHVARASARAKGGRAEGGEVGGGYWMGEGAGGEGGRRRRRWSHVQNDVAAVSLKHQKLKAIIRRIKI